MGEFELISRYFEHGDKRVNQADILQTIGDDCAVVGLLPEQQLVVTTDTLVSGTHFLPNISPSDLAYKSVIVNLSDIAAMGATPRWISLALTLPSIDHTWLAAFSQSMFDVLDLYDVALIGGDTTKGHLSLSITAQGLLPKGLGLFRHKANVGDWIYVSGTLGDSSAGLDLILNSPSELNSAQQFLLTRHLRPTARVALGQLLTQFSCCAIDISDGLLADLGHILKRSQCGAALDIEYLPLSSALTECYARQQAEYFALTGGEDYELCFTVSDEQRLAMEQAVQAIGEKCHCIGRIVSAEQGLSLWKKGEIYPLPARIGFDHFG